MQQLLRRSILFTLLTICAFNLEAQENGENKTIMLAILAKNKAHVLPQFLACIENLDYPKHLISLYINTNNNEDSTKEILKSWIREHKSDYQRIIFKGRDLQHVKSTRPHEWTSERFKVLATIRNQSLQKAKEYQTDYYFVVDCDNFITPDTLKELIHQDKPIIAPLLKAIPEPHDSYSNFFCAVSASGYYENHPNYIKILSRQMKGTFKVPVVHCTYLIKSEYIDKLNYIDGSDDYEFVIFSRTARNNKVDQYICNEKNFGVLLHFHNDLTLEEEKKRVADIDIAGLLLGF